jgi:hypothetical protein
MQCTNASQNLKFQILNFKPLFLNMRWLSIILLLLVVGCTGSLTEEQRKAIKEDMESHEIKKVSDAQLTEAAFAKGREIIAHLEQVKSDSVKTDSIVGASDGKIRWLIPGASNAVEVEQQLIEAYIASASGGAQDNVQKIRESDGTPTDSILYSKPVVIKQKDGTDVLTGVWNIWLSRKELIKAMD